MTKRIIRICGSVFLVLVLAHFFKPLFAQELSPSESNQLEQKVVLLEAKLERFKSTQARILERQARVAEELESLKVWIRHNRH